MAANPAMVVRILGNLDGLKAALAQAQGHIAVTRDALRHMTAALDGSKLEARAHTIAAAIQDIGGVTRLTDNEARRHLQTLNEWVQKGTRLGRDLPPGILSTRDALQQVVDASNQAVTATAALSKSGGGFLGDLTSQVKATALGFLGAQAVIGGVETGIRALGGFVMDSVQSFATAEAAAKKLTVALQTSGRATPAVMAQFDAMATQFQRTTVYSDDLITEMQALLVQVGGVLPGKMEAALQASTDLASGLGMDLQSAVMLVAKAFAGGGDELGRLKAILGDAYQPAKGLDGVLASLEQKFGGQAQAEIATYAGRVKQLANDFDNFKETIGGAFVLSPSLELLLRALSGQARASGSLGRSSLADLVFSLNPAMSEGLTLLDAWAVASNKAAAASDAFAQTVATNLQRAAAAAGGAWKTLLPPTAVEVVAGLASAYRPLTDVQQRAAAAAQEHARAIQDLRDQLSGKGAIEAATNMREALRGLGPVSALTASRQRQINEAMDAALQVYEAAGTQGPKWMLELWKATQAPPAVLASLADMNRLLTEIFAKAQAVLPLIPSLTATPGIVGGRPGADLEKPAIPKVGLFMGFQDVLSKGLPDVLMRAFTGGGHAMRSAGGLLGETFAKNLTGKVGGFLGKHFGKTLGTAMGSVIPGVGTILGGMAGELLGPLASKVGGFFKNILGFGTAGRSLVKDFAEQFGGFDTLHAKLSELGDAGERLWIKLTQGVGRNNAAGARAAIDEVTRALETHRKTVDADAAATEEASRRAIAAQQEAVDRARAALKELDNQIASLQKSIENEAPEEVMGIVETETRARIAALQKERDAAAQHVQELEDKLTESLNRVAEAIEKIPHEIDIKVRTRYADPELPGFAHGTDGYEYFGAGTPVVLHGWEKVTPLGKDASSGLPREMVVRVPLMVDGREVAEAVGRVLLGR